MRYTVISGQQDRSAFVVDTRIARTICHCAGYNAPKHAEKIAAALNESEERILRAVSMGIGEDHALHHIPLERSDAS